MEDCETITISLEEYERLMEVDRFMDALYAAGIDDTQAYEHAQDIVENQK